MLHLVNLRVGDSEGPRAESIGEAFETLVDLQRQGLIRHLGISNATGAQNVAGAGLPLASDDLAALDTIGR